MIWINLEKPNYQGPEHENAPEVIIDQGDESDDEIEEVDLVNTDIFSKYPNFN